MTTLHQHLLDLGYTMADLSAIKTLVINTTFDGINYIVSFNLQYPANEALFKLFNVDNLTVTVDLANNILHLTHFESEIVNQVVNLTGNLYHGLELANTEFARSIVRGKPHYAVIGLYYFLNKVNGKGYVGKSEKLSNRFRDHLAYGSTKLGDLQLIHLALRKYGFSKFWINFFTLAHTAELHNIGVPLVLKGLEQFMLDHLINTEYNIHRFSDDRLIAGSAHPSYNTGRPIYLYKVKSDEWYISKSTYYDPVKPEDLEFVEKFPNVSRAIEITGVVRPRLYRTLKNPFKPIYLNSKGYHGVYYFTYDKIPS